MTIMTNDKSSISKQATQKILAALNRADELGGEVRDFLQDKVAADPRYIATRKRLAQLMGKSFVSKDEAAQKAHAAEQARAAKAAVTVDRVVAAEAKKAAGFGDPSVKAQIFGKKSCPWSGRAITILERLKVDFDWVDLEEPEHEAKLIPLGLETKQHTVPYVYLRGHFIGGYNALAEVERLGQLDLALMTPEERAAAPAHQKHVEIVARPNTDEVVPAEEVV
jgi:glutaredoxin